MYILDFDGVIVDSVDEAALTAYNSLKSELIQSPLALPPGYLRIFKEQRSIVGPASEFLPFARWCERQEEGFLTRAELKELAATELLTSAERTKLFFEKRLELMNAIATEWPSLHRTYQPLANALRNYSPGAFLILTYKNVDAVLSLCRFFGIPAKDEHIFAGDKGRSKIDNLQFLKARFPAASYTFIDDNIENLLEIAATAENIQLIHAAWGYCTEEDVSTAEANNILSLNCQQFTSLLATKSK